MEQNTKRNSSKRAPKEKSKKKIIIFSVEIFLILIMLAVLFLVMTNGGEGPLKPDVVWDDNMLGIENGMTPNTGDTADATGDVSDIANADLSADAIISEDYINIALFGLDAKKLDSKKSQLMKGNNSDCIMIASVNKKTGDIRLVSVYRDTYLNIGTDRYFKCNRAYMEGGAEQAIKTLNMNLNLNIRQFVTVGYQSLIDLVDGLGGVYIDVDKNELKHINNYQITIQKDLGLPDYTPVKETGRQLLNGLQATAYCRVRYDLPGGDFDRASNQREVIKAIEAKAKETDVATLTKIFNKVIGEIYTNIDNETLMELVTHINDYRIVEEGGFPEKTMITTANMDSKGSVVIPLDLEANVVWLHQFLFEDDQYTATDTVKECSNKIQTDYNKYR